MSNARLLELREESAVESGDTGGQWQTQLIEPTTVASGDALAVKQAFIDTRSQASGKIVLDADVDCEVQGALYLQDWLPGGGPNTAVYEVPGPVPTNQAYVLSLVSPHGTTPAGYVFLDSWQFETVGSSHDWGHVPNVCIEYTSLDGNPGTQTYRDIPTVSKNTRYYQMPIGVIGLAGSFVILDPTRVEKLGSLYIKSETTRPLTSDAYTHVTRSQKFTIPKGNYEPTEIAEFITDTLTQNQQGSTFTGAPVVSPWLASLKELQAAHQTAFVNADGSNIVTYPTTSDLWVGSSQMAMIFDPTTQRFAWSFLHFPLYDASADIVTSFLKQSTSGTPGDGVLATRNGGVILTSLTPSSFWFDTLKLPQTCVASFETADLTVGSVYAHLDRVKGDPAANLTAGVNATEATPSIDAGVVKNATFYDVPTIPNPPALLSSTSSNTTEIWGSELTSTAAYSHFLIEITAMGVSTIVGSARTMKQIRAIVGSYFSEGGFTSGDSSTALPYIHEGEGFQIQSMTVRILAPDGTPATGLGTASCVYVEHVAASPSSSASSS